MEADGNFTLERNPYFWLVDTDGNQLPYLDEWTEKRIEAAHRYRLNLSENPKIKMMEVKEGNRCVYHIFPIFIKNRSRIQQELLSHGIQTGLHYPKPIHLQKAYRKLGHKRGDFPIAEKQKEKLIMFVKSWSQYYESKNTRVERRRNFYSQ